MHKPRNFDSELRALTGKAKQLRARKLDQLGELVIACADARPIERLAGALLAAIEADPRTMEGWRPQWRCLFSEKRWRCWLAMIGTRRSAPSGDSA